MYRARGSLGLTNSRDLPPSPPTSEQSRKFTTINTLNDDIFFSIFNYYRLDVQNAWNVRFGWFKISHVCRRWRHFVHSWAFHLSMYIRCSYGSPTADTLDHLHFLPLSVDYSDETATISEQDDLAIRHALLLHDRVRHIRLKLPPSTLQELVKEMDKPFLNLKYLSLSCSGEEEEEEEEDVNLVLPKTFHAPNLRNLTLLGIGLPKGLPLLSSTVSLITIELRIARASGYFSPKILVARLRSLPQLEELFILFSDPMSCPSAERKPLDEPEKSVTLPNLKYLMFKGVSTYLECLVAQIKAPLLERLDTSLFSQIAYVLPHLSRFINTTEAVKFLTATLFFDNRGIFTITDRKGYGGPSKFSLSVTSLDSELDSQIDTASQICSALMSTLSGVQKLKLDLKGLITPSENGEIGGTTWHGLLRPFVSVNELRICDTLSEELSRALQVDDVGSDPGFLPSLQEIVAQSSGAALFGPFIHARQLADRPVRLRLTHETVVDPVVALNNWLQRTIEGNVTRELIWLITQEGSDKHVVHRAELGLRGVSLGIGTGVSKGRAKSAAAEKALGYLRREGLPPGGWD